MSEELPVIRLRQFNILEDGTIVSTGNQTLILSAQSLGPSSVGGVGPQGPIGPTGPTGATGSQGIQGNTGPAGEIPSNYVVSVNGLTGIISLAAGSNITIIPTGNTLTISSTGGGVGGSGISFDEVLRITFIGI
jgi:hypothetical protein